MNVKKKMRRVVAIAPIMVVAASLIAVACRDATAPERLAPGAAPTFVKFPADFRLTGGGRIDQREHLGNAKSTPESRDFATFGFQVRPGSVNLTWVEHNPAEALGGGFTFHATTLDDFQEIVVGPDETCGFFSGTGTLRTRSGLTDNNAQYAVVHACDRDEPGVGNDHIWIDITTTIAPGHYGRHGILSGGNIQEHKL